MQILRYGVQNLEIYKLTILWSALKINIGFTYWYSHSQISFKTHFKYGKSKFFCF